VLQQSSTTREPALGLDRSLEQEAVQAVRTAEHGMGPISVAPDIRSDGKVQRQDPNIPDSLLHPFTSQGMFQLQLDPQIEFELFRLGIRRWLMLGEAPTAAPIHQNVSGDTPVDSASTPAAESDRPLDPVWFTPDVLSQDPNVGAILSSFASRGVGASAGDVDVAMRLFRDRYRFVLALPDLRAMVPDFARSWIPLNWRVRIAESLTNMTIDANLRHDHPTFIEAADRFMLDITGDRGAMPIYFRLPSISF
jgi:hypothetical protein